MGKDGKKNRKDVFSIGFSILKFLKKIFDVLNGEKIRGRSLVERCQSDETIKFYYANILYDGIGYKSYNLTSDKFYLGSKPYNSGFTMYSIPIQKSNDFQNSYVLMDLENKFSKISFRVGRVSGDSNNDAKLFVYCDNEIYSVYKLSGKKAYEDIEIQIIGCYNLRFELALENNATYGFAQILLHK